MADIQTALSQAINEWEQAVDAQITPANQAPMGVSQATFEFIMNNPGKFKRVVIRELEAQGYKPSSTTTLISAMVRQNKVHMDIDKRLTAIAKSYTPVQARSKQQAKTKPVNPVKQGIAALPIAAVKGFDVDVLIDSLTLRQAMMLRKRLNDIFIGEQV